MAETPKPTGDPAQPRTDTLGTRRRCRPEHYPSVFAQVDNLQCNPTLHADVKERLHRKAHPEGLDERFRNKRDRVAQVIWSGGHEPEIGAELEVPDSEAHWIAEGFAIHAKVQELLHEVPIPERLAQWLDRTVDRVAAVICQGTNDPGIQAEMEDGRSEASRLATVVRISLGHTLQLHEETTESWRRRWEQCHGELGEERES